MLQKPKSRLGRGLSSLISLSEEPKSTVSEAPATPPPVAPPPSPASNSPVAATVRADVEPTIPGTRIAEIALDQIVPNPHQPRRTMDESTIAELASSLKTTGLIQPIVVRKAGAQFQLIAGERRWRAAKMAGLITVLAIVRETNSVEQAQMALVENIHRENLNPIDRAQAYKTLMTQLGLTQAELANRTAEDRSSVANFLRLLELSSTVQAMVADGRLSMGHAKILAGVTEHSEQERLAQLVVAQSLSVRNLERQLQTNPPAAPAPKASAAHLQALEKSISQQLGLRVQLRSGAKKGKGKLILHYGSLDQFDELVGKLGVKIDS